MEGGHIISVEVCIHSFLFLEMKAVLHVYTYIKQTEPVQALLRSFSNKPAPQRWLAPTYWNEPYTEIEMVSVVSFLVATLASEEQTRPVLTPAICTIFWFICACVIFPFWSTWCITGSMGILKGQKRKHDFLHTYLTQMLVTWLQEKTKSGYTKTQSWFLSTSISPDKKPRLPDLLPTWRLDLLRTNASWPVRGLLGMGQQPLEGLKRVSPRFSKKNIFFRQAGKVHDSESDDSSDGWNCYATKKLQKRYQRHDSLDIIRKKSWPLQRHEIWKQKSFPPGRRVLVKSCIEMWS